LDKDKTYSREIIHLDKEMEIVLITWQPDAESMPHDHGESSGMVSVISGTIVEETFDKVTKKFLASSTLKAGDRTFENKDTIHIMKNPSSGEVAKTLHVYIPPLCGRGIIYLRGTLEKTREAKESR